MAAQLDLKQIERKAFRSTYEDGLWDIYYGLVVVGMSIFIYRPEAGYSPMNIILSTLIITLSYALFWAGKKYITVPRMGQVKFGPERKQKNKKLAIILGVFVLFQVILVGLTALGWMNPQASSALNSTLTKYDAGLLVVALIGSSILGISMIVIAHYTDFPRGYYIAILMALAVFLMIYLNQPIYAIVIGILIIIPGVVLFVRFLKKYPKPDGTGSHE
jgi:hypothetical protein